MNLLNWVTNVWKRYYTRDSQCLQVFGITKFTGFHFIFWFNMDVLRNERPKNRFTRKINITFSLSECWVWDFFRVQNMENLNNENKVFDYILNKDTSEKLVFSRNWEYALFAPTTTKSDTLFTIQNLAFKRTFQYYKVMFEFNWCYYKFI